MNFSLSHYLDQLRQLVAIDSGTYHKKGIETIADIMSNMYSNLNWKVIRHDFGDAGPGLEIRNHPESDTIDVMLIGHMDTVFPEGTAAERPFRVDGARAFGPGVADMKSGLLSITYALRGLSKELSDALSICVCLNPDEEIGSPHSKDWLRSVARMARCALVAEPARADGSMVKARKGIALYRLSFTGRAAHAGNEPEKGRSAIVEMAQWITALDKLSDFERGLTLNTGVVHGGIGANTVAEHAEAMLDLRFWNDEDHAAVKQQLRALAESPFVGGVTVEVECESSKSAMPFSETSAELLALVESAARELALEIDWKSVGGVSDGNEVASLGVPVLDGFGPIGGGFHTPDEYLELDSIEARIQLLRKVLDKIATVST